MCVNVRAGTIVKLFLPVFATFHYTLRPSSGLSILKVKPSKKVGWNVNKKYTNFHIKSDINQKKYSNTHVINDWQDNTTNCQSKL